MTKIRLMGSAIALAAFVASGPAAAQLSTAISTSQQTAQDTARSQGRIDDLDDETARLLQDFRAEQKQLDQLVRYNESLRKQIEGQEEEIVAVGVQIESISGLQRSVTPLMEDMLASFEAFVAADAPFLSEERAKRVARLRGNLEDPNLSAAQKYRGIIEGYQVENEFGRTVGVDDEVIDGKQVEVLRIGRVTVIYKAKDDSELKIFNRESGQWEDLPGSYLDDVRLAIRMAKEQIPPNLLPIPVIVPAGQ